jgi:hypothetical protein
MAKPHVSIGKQGHFISFAFRYMPEPESIAGTAVRVVTACDLYLHRNAADKEGRKIAEGLVQNTRKVGRKRVVTPHCRDLARKAAMRNAMCRVSDEGARLLSEVDEVHAPGEHAILGQQGERVIVYKLNYVTRVKIWASMLQQCKGRHTRKPAGPLYTVSEAGGLSKKLPAADVITLIVRGAILPCDNGTFQMDATFSWPAIAELLTGGPAPDASETARQLDTALAVQDIAG